MYKKLMSFKIRELLVDWICLLEQPGNINEDSLIYFKNVLLTKTLIKIVLVIKRLLSRLYKPRWAEERKGCILWEKHFLFFIGLTS